MKFIILSRLTHDNDLLKYLTINLAGMAGSNMLESINIAVSIGATVLTCSAGLVLVFYKVRQIKKELNEKP